MISHPSIVLVAIAKKENDYINEWLKWHSNLMFSKIVIYDNNNANDDSLEKSINFQFKDNIEIIDMRGIEAAQFIAYNDAYTRYSSYDYIMFLDIDEFLILNIHSSIGDLLNSISKNALLIRFNWDMYDDNDLITRNESIPVMEAFTRRAVTKKALKFNYRSKYALKTGLSNIKIDSAHFAYIDKPVFANLVTYTPSNIDITRMLPNKRCLDLPIIDYATAKVNHYITKSLSEFIKLKMARGDVAFKNKNLDFDNYYWHFNQKTNSKLDFIGKL